MEKKFKKIMSVVGSALVVGSMGFALASGGVPFVQNSQPDYAIVYGVNAAASDITAANSINAHLNTFYSETSTGTTSTSSIVTGDFSSSASISDEIELGQEDITINSKLREKLEDNKLSTLLDTSIEWDNGDRSEDYDIHEEILLTNEAGDSKLNLVTNLNHPNGEDLNSFVVLQNDESLRYRLVFDDFLEFSEDDKEDARGLKVSILGKEYEITDFDDDFEDITISLSEERVVKQGSVINLEGVTLTIGTIFDDALEINGVIINEDDTKKVNGLEIEVMNVALHTDATLSKALIRVGKDIERDIKNGDEYIEDDEAWEWDMGINSDNKQYIGVKYALRNIAYDEDEPQENPLVPGESYIFPENYAALSFEGLTNVTYKDYELSFDDKDLYEGKEKIGNDIDVAILEGEEDDSITLNYDSNEVETNSLYFKYINKTGVEVYFKDIDGDAEGERKGKIQLADMYNFNVGDVTNNVSVPLDGIVNPIGEITITGYEYVINEITTVPAFPILDKYFYFNEDVLTIVPLDGTVNPIEEMTTITGYEYVINETTTVPAFPILEGDEIVGYKYEVTTPGTLEDKSYSVAKLVVKDTEIDVGLDLNADNTVYLTLTNGEEVTKMQLGIDDSSFKHLGEEEDDAESGEIIVGDKNIGTMDYDVMDSYGTIIKDPENYAESDRVMLSIPDEQVYATISVKGQGEEIVTENTNSTETTTITTPNLGGIIVKDTEIASVNTKNLIIVGGSCINAEAAKLLGGNACGSDFTLKTGITAGKALIQSFTSPYTEGKIAVVIAGYNAADTTMGVNRFINNGINIAVGQKTVI